MSGKRLDSSVCRVEGWQSDAGESRRNSDSNEAKPGTEYLLFQSWRFIDCGSLDHDLYIHKISREASDVDCHSKTRCHLGGGFRRSGQVASDSWLGPQPAVSELPDTRISGAPRVR